MVTARQNSVNVPLSNHHTNSSNDVSWRGRCIHTLKQQPTGLGGADAVGLPVLTKSTIDNCQINVCAK